MRHVIIEGPLQPDLFGGQTPTMLVCRVRRGDNLRLAREVVLWRKHMQTVLPFNKEAA